jgi:hypothetical protein
VTRYTAFTIQPRRRLRGFWDRSTPALGIAHPCRSGVGCIFLIGERESAKLGFKAHPHMLRHALPAPCGRISQEYPAHRELAPDGSKTLALALQGGDPLGPTARPIAQIFSVSDGSVIRMFSYALIRSIAAWLPHRSINSLRSSSKPLSSDASRAPRTITHRCRCVRCELPCYFHCAVHVFSSALNRREIAYALEAESDWRISKRSSTAGLLRRSAAASLSRMRLRSEVS